MFHKDSKHKPISTKNQNTKQIGDWAEQRALDYLINKGFVLMHRQFRCAMGECDLIMKDKQTIVFIEVRYKQNTTFCAPEETIHWGKQRKLIKTAEYFLVRYPNMDCRFDVIAISGRHPNVSIDWIPDAFGVE